MSAKSHIRVASLAAVGAVAALVACVGNSFAAEVAVSLTWGFPL
jgi:hypothetical protein